MINFICAKCGEPCINTKNGYTTGCDHYPVSGDAVDEKTINEMWDFMDFCNGEIRVMAGRYGGGWLAVGCSTTEWDFDLRWENLVGGDNDYFEARDFFNNNANTALVEGAASARSAFDECEHQLSKTILQSKNDGFIG